MENQTTELRLFTAYLKDVPKDSDLAALCMDIASDESILAIDDIHTMLEAGIALVVAPPIWVWAAYELNARRNRQQTDEAQKRIGMITDLMERHGLKQKDAERLMANTLATIAKQDKDNSALNQILTAANTIKKILPTEDLTKMLKDESEDDTPNIEKE